MTHALKRLVGARCSKYTTHLRGPVHLTHNCSNTGPWWFNLGVGTVHVYFPPGWGVPGLCIFPLVAFHRVYDDHTSWGFGLLQVNCRYLIGVVSNEEKFQVDFFWTHLALEKRSNG